MADQSDVETALVAAIVAALYPNGTGAASAIGNLCRVYRGWPNAAALDADLAAGTVNVSVFPTNGGARTTTRYPDAWQTLAIAPATLSATVDGSAATFSGSGASGLLAGLAVDGTAYVYAVQATDSAALVAASLGAQVAADRLARVAGATIALPGATTVLARVVGPQQALRELRRQTQDFRVSCWCPDFASRDAVAAAIDYTLAQIHFMPLPDGAQGRLTFAGGTVVDQSEDATLYRRDLIYAVEYPTTYVQSQPSMLFGDFTLNAVVRAVS